MASGDSGSARRPGRRVAQALGVALSVAGLIFVLRAIAVRWDDVRVEVADISVGWLVAALGAATCGMTLIALRWRASIHLAGGDLPAVDTVALYFRGEVAKYVPGGVWAVVGRAELARRRGMPWRVAYASVTLSLVGLYAGATLTVGALAPVTLGFPPWARALWVSAAVLAAGAFSRVARRPVVADRLVVPRPAALARLASGYLPAWLFIGAATWCVARSITGDVPFDEVLFATAVSWLAGFLALPVPGGIGVREAVFVAVLGPLPGDVAAVVALFSRVLFMLTDAAGAMVASAAGWAAPARSDSSEDERPGEGAEHQ